MHGLRKYFTGRFFWYLLTLVVAVVLNFLLPRMIPGNPMAAIAGNITKGMTDTNSIKRVYEQLNREFGLNEPLWKQLFLYVGNLFHGNLGTSISQYPRSVASILASSVPWSVALQLPAIIVGWLLGNILGAVAAYRRGVFDKVIFPTFLFLSCLPAFAMAILLVWIFGMTLKIAPVSGAFGFDMNPNFSLQFFASVIQHYQLPFWSIVLINIGGQALGMREMSIYELNADYVKYSRLLGIHDRKITGYVFKNAMLPQITGLALSIGTMVGGALIAEIIFSYPGIGTSMLNAVTSQDFPLISGCTLIITITVLAANFLIDVIYGFIDPRIRSAQEEEK